MPPPAEISRTSSAIRAQHDTDFAFGSYAPARVFQRGIGGGFHEPVARPAHEQGLDFKTWMDRWTSPESVRPVARHHADSGASTSRTPSVFCEGGSAVIGALAKITTYPNPTNWKRSTSLPTRTPGYVGYYRTR
mmetsp:Transcript_88752/g.249983  ORF Transcript_88752/g.249983 Transcript_88752/m.249983 type:complete len:134 (-) Transcript_88752:31-432(-)